MNLFRYTKEEERVHVISHVFGGVIAIIFLYILTKNTEGLLETVSVSLFSMSMFLMYLCSSMYHYVTREELKKLYKKFDHSAIFIFILGTYIPFCVVGIGSKKAILLMLFLTLVTILGVVIKMFYAGRYKKLSTVMYLLMGWSCILIMKDLVVSISVMSLFFLALGGILYSVGAVIYALCNFKYHHAIWHVFVILASVSHAISIYILL